MNYKASQTIMMISLAIVFCLLASATNVLFSQNQALKGQCRELRRENLTLELEKRELQNKYKISLEFIKAGVNPTNKPAVKH